MLFSPTKALEEGWVFGENICKDSIQPNGIDFKLDRIFRLDNTPFTLLKDSKTNRKSYELLPDKNNSFLLNKNSQYDVLTNLKVKLPADVAATCIIRSSMSRNGLLLGNGLYDSGYEGTVGTVIHIPNIEVYLEKDVRIGQIIFHSAQSAFKYQGQYQGNMDYWKDSKGK